MTCQPRSGEGKHGVQPYYIYLFIYFLIDKSERTPYYIYYGYHASEGIKFHLRMTNYSYKNGSFLLLAYYSSKGLGWGKGEDYSIILSELHSLVGFPVMVRKWFYLQLMAVFCLSNGFGE